MCILASGYTHLHFSKFLGILRPNFTFEATGKILLNRNVAIVLLTDVYTDQMPAIGSGRSTIDHMTRYLHGTCHRLEPWVTTILVPTPPILVTGG